MPFTVEWGIPQRVVNCQITGDLSGEDAQQAAARIGELVNEGAAPVHVIVDVSHMGKFPVSVSQLNTASRWVYLPATGWAVTINASRVMNLLATIITNMAGVKHRSAKDVEEALVFLRRVDASLPASAGS